MSLGSAISAARESAGMTLDDLAARTSIRASLLREFEENNFAKCGGETYARGHVRNIANAVGADPVRFLEIFEAEQETAKRPMQELLVENRVMPPAHQKSRISLKALSMVSASAVVLVVGGQIAYSNFQPTKSAKNIVAAATNNVVAPAPVAPADPASDSAANSALADAPSGGVTVEVTATRGDTWLSVSSKAGVAIFSGRLSRGDITTFSDQEGIVIRYGNAGAVDLVVNGAAAGAPGSVGEVVDASYGLNTAN